MVSRVKMLRSVYPISTWPLKKGECMRKPNVAEYGTIVGIKTLKLTAPCKAWIERQENANSALRKLILLQVNKEKDPSNKLQTGYPNDEHTLTTGFPRCSLCGLESKRFFSVENTGVVCVGCLIKIVVPVFQKSLKEALSES